MNKVEFVVSDLSLFYAAYNKVNFGNNVEDAGEIKISTYDKYVFLSREYNGLFALCRICRMQADGIVVGEASVPAVALIELPRTINTQARVIVDDCDNLHIQIIEGDNV